MVEGAERLRQKPEHLEIQTETERSREEREVLRLVEDLEVLPPPDEDLEEYERQLGEGVMQKLYRAVKETKLGRLSLGAFTALSVLKALGVDIAASEKIQEYVGSSESSEELAKEVIDSFPRLQGMEVKGDQSTKDKVDAAITGVIDELSISNNGATARQLARICEREKVVFEGEEKVVLDAEKVVMVYGDQLRMYKPGITKDKVISMIGEGSGRTASEIKKISSIVKDSVFERPKGGAGITALNFQGEDEFRGKFEDEEIVEVYNGIFEGEVELTTQILRLTDYENLNDIHKEEVDRMLSAISESFVDLNISAMRAGVEIRDAGEINTGKENLFSEGGLVSDYQYEMSGFKTQLLVLDTWIEESDLETKRSFVQVGESFEQQLDGYIGGLMENKAEAAGSLRGAEDWKKAAKEL